MGRSQKTEARYKSKTRIYLSADEHHLDEPYSEGLSTRVYVRKAEDLLLLEVRCNHFCCFGNELQLRKAVFFHPTTDLPSRHLFSTKGCRGY